DTLENLASAALKEGRFADGYSILRDALQIALELNEPFEVAIVLSHVAEVLAAARNANAATRLLSAAEAMRERTGGSREYVIARRDRALAALRARLNENAFATAWEEGRTLTVEQAIELALDPPN
ncbi:MAG TPA: hypothetical protein VFY15_00845, partial [Acidimicrobiia bacterium]|nr:hypothetical protein [Acidimicrobiia bacterium]